MAKTKNNDKGESIDYRGCYGPRVSYSELQDFLIDAFESDDWSETNNPTERFSTCLWGNPGCVLAGTKIRVRKVSDNGKLDIIHL